MSHHAYCSAKIELTLSPLTLGTMIKNKLKKEEK
jgi:hypothetical protein